LLFTHYLITSFISGCSIKWFVFCEYRSRKDVTVSDLCRISSKYLMQLNEWKRRLALQYYHIIVHG